MHINTGYDIHIIDWGAACGIQANAQLGTSPWNRAQTGIFSVPLCKVKARAVVRPAYNVLQAGFLSGCFLSVIRKERSRTDTNRQKRQERWIYLPWTRIWPGPDKSHAPQEYPIFNWGFGGYELVCPPPHAIWRVSYWMSGAGGDEEPTVL